MPASWPDKALVKQEIGGTEVNLVPLVPVVHAKALLALFTKAEKWTYLRDGPFLNLPAYTEHLKNFQLQTAVAAYVITERRTGDILGKVSLLHANVASKSIEIGYCVFGDRLIGHPSGRQAIGLLLDVVFERFGCNLCEWRCDVRNIASAKFAKKFSFRQTEILENHMVVKGHYRDTLVFQLKRRDWAGIGAIQ